jgi:hypothetical protein
MERSIGIAALALFVGYHVNAQHEHHNMQDTANQKYICPIHQK